MSSKNPFQPREEVVLAPSPPLPPLPAPSPPPRPSGSHAQTSSQAPPLASKNFEDDLPPPYTPAANIGEETIDLGPRRPFQQPPPLPSSSSSSHRPPDQPPYPNWSPQPRPAGSSYHVQPSPDPWQRWPQQHRQRQKQNGGLIGALIDTVRDIADAVSGVDERTMASQRANASAYAVPQPPGGHAPHAPYGSPSGPPGQTYQSPPGPPPSEHAPYAPYGSHSGPSRQTYQPPPGPPPPRPVSAPPHSPPAVADDGTPTRTPVPGHPLLLDGRLLVYPRDHLCVKCKNTGYKDYDPSHPCRKCWDKYGRPYTGALAYTSWAPSGNDPRMQRPLPRFPPPHLAGRSPGSSRSPPSLYPPPPRHPYHSRSISQPSGPSYYVINPFSPTDQPPVPDAIPVRAGDPRLGGRLCLRCGGDGVRTVMLIDVITCDNCDGTGRIWR